MGLYNMEDFALRVLIEIDSIMVNGDIALGCNCIESFVQTFPAEYAVGKVMYKYRSNADVRALNEKYYPTE